MPAGAEDGGDVGGGAGVNRADLIQWLLVLAIVIVAALLIPRPGIAPTQLRDLRGIEDRIELIDKRTERIEAAVDRVEKAAKR